LTYPSEKYEIGSWDEENPNFSWTVIQNSMDPVTTNQIISLCHIYCIERDRTISADVQFPAPTPTWDP
jgi:hypothetical protein